MNEHLPVGREASELFQNQVLGHYDAPAYVRRALRVQDALRNLFDVLGGKRDEWLTMVRLRLGQLLALAGDWAMLLPLLRDEDRLKILKDLYSSLSPKLRSPVERTTSQRVLSQALLELQESMALFNRRWRQHLQRVDLGPINALRADYNRYYLLEKECAMGSSRLARQGFSRLELVTHADLEGWLPLLPTLT
jgi:hypothetical protein